MDRGEYGYADLLFDMCIVPDEQIDDSLPARLEPPRALRAGRDAPTALHGRADPAVEERREPAARAVGAGVRRGEGRRPDLSLRRSRLAVRAGHAKRSLAGLPPASLPVRVFDRLRAFIETRRASRPGQIPSARHRVVSMLREK